MAVGTEAQADISSGAAAAVRRPRYALIDMARGVAILLMFVYHFSWDLTFFGFARFDLFGDARWIWFARIIVMIILFVMGMAQVMARRRRNRNPRAYFRRLGLVAGGAALVSLATFLADPNTFIFFGILHHIALASVILAVVITLPSWALAALAALCLAAPFFLSSPVFAADWLLWVGLTPSPPLSVDYVPLVPWFAVPLAGVLFGRLTFRGGEAPVVLHWQPTHPGLRLVHLVGRHSLLLYMIHQPILFGGLYLLAASLGRIN